MIVKEFECLEHGYFEGSHPICPALGCDSRAVGQVFLTPPTIRSGMMKQFDAGIRRSSDMMGGKNFRTARAGEAAYGGDAGRELGMEVLWGSDVKRKMGRSFHELTGIAQKPLVVKKRDGSGELRLDRNNAMADAATDIGITRRRLPMAGEVRADDKSVADKAKALTT